VYCFFAASSPDISAGGLAYYTNNEGVEVHIIFPILRIYTWIERLIDIEGGTPDIGYPISPWNCFIHLSTISGLPRKIIDLIIY